MTERRISATNESHRRFGIHERCVAAEKLDVPTLVLSGDKTTATSELTDPELKRLLPAESSKRVTVKDARHIMFTDQPETCLKVVLEFFQESRKGTSD